MIVKVCGLKDPKNIAEIDDIVGIDMLGFNFYPKSARYISPNDLKDEVADLHCKKIGVFVDEKLDILMNIRNLLTLDYVQLHGHESEGYIKECMAVTKIIRAIGVENEDDMKRVADLDYCHFLLFDKKSPAFGGTGVKFDWKLLESYHGEKPFIIAGGISEDDVEQILAIQHPKFSGIDINSKFETTPGIKDTNKIKSFIKALKN